MCKTRIRVTAPFCRYRSRRDPVYRHQGASYTLSGSPSTGAILKKIYTQIRVAAVKGLMFYEGTQRDNTERDIYINVL